MKTFSTEKHNIPEGATHYDNESCLTHFAWFKLDGDNLLCMPITYPDRWFPCSLELYKDSIKPIPQTKEVEWVGGLPPVGVECEVMIDDSGKWKLCEILFSSKQSVVVVKLKSGAEIAIDPFASSFRKPETEAERVERERLEAAYDLYLAFWSASNSSVILESFKGFSCGESADLKHFLAVVDKTNYRKSV